ncbi:hypothetical protein MJT46_008485 [Ovis ammon polii x Ovis aries]|nr:hypothetical protein MJT46_008485 [Ovis ammon polii x Ovis aries]
MDPTASPWSPVIRTQSGDKRHERKTPNLNEMCEHFFYKNLYVFLSSDMLGNMKTILDLGFRSRSHNAVRLSASEPAGTLWGDHRLRRRRRRRGLRRARGVRRCGCRAGRMSAAARATGASTWGTFRAQPSERRAREGSGGPVLQVRPHQRDRAQESARPRALRLRALRGPPEMLRMQFMEGTVTIMASVGFVWSSPGLTEVGVGGPAVGGVGLLREDLISEFLFQDFLHQAAGRT